MAEALENKF